MRRVLGTVIVLAALALGLWWLAGSADRTTAPRAARPTELERERAMPELVAPARAAPLEPSSAPEPAAREAVLSPAEREFGQARWIDGRVLFPPSTPDDEQCFVVAQARNFENGSSYRSSVERDGTYRVPLPANARGGWVELEARYLFLTARDHWIELSDATTATLAPLIGGCVVGHVLPAANAVAYRLRGTLTLENGRSRHVREFVTAGTTDPADAAFVLAQIPPDEGFTLTYADEFLRQGSSGPISVWPGVTQTVDLQLEETPLVSRISGRVVDERGRPLAGIALSGSSAGTAAARARPAHSDASGNFTMLVPSGACRLQCGRESKRGQVEEPAHELQLELAPYEERSGVEVVLAGAR